MAPKLYTRLREALSNLSAGDRVWATDVYRNYTDREGNRKKYVGKRYWVAKLVDWHRYLVTFRQPCAYELIRSNAPCKLYFDIETSIEEEDLTERRARMLTTLIMRLLKRHIMFSLPNPDLDVVCFHACSKAKFSLHVIFPNILMDNTQVSMIAFVAETVAFFEWAKENMEAKMDCADMKWAISKLNEKLIDMSVYKVNQLFRIPGNTKFQQNRPLRTVDVSSDNAGVINIDIDDWKYSDCVKSIADLKRFLVTCVDESEELLKVMPSKHLELLSPTYFCEEFYSRDDLRDDMLPSGRYIKPKSIIRGDGSKRRRVIDERQNRIQTLQEKNRLGLTNKRDIYLLDDDEHVVREDGSKILARYLHVAEVIYCNRCDFENGAPFGVPSAKSFCTPGDEIGIYCFNCSSITWVLSTSDQEGFTITDEEQLVITPYDKLNYKGRVDIDFTKISSKIFVLDAPMGSGKTFIADDYVRNQPDQSILVITFRISLARYLATRFGMKCYLETDAFDDDNDRRIVVCLDSIWKIQRSAYDLVILDEATFIRHHFVSGTIKEKISCVIRKFTMLLQSACRIIIMQHRVTDACIDFFCSLSGCDPDSDVTKRKFDRPVPLLPVKVTNDLPSLVGSIIKRYLDNFDVDDQLSKSPMVIFCTRADYAMFLMWLLRDIAKVRFGDEACNRIRGIWSTVQDEPWNKEFLDSPNKIAHECDVVIVTTVLQAGHSFDRWFKISYDILFVGVVSFREELQLISRLRILDRKAELSPFKYAYIEKGRANCKLASYDQIYKYICDESAFTDVAHILAGVLASVRSERADSYNRHFWLWNREYKTNNVKFETIEEILSHPEYDKTFVIEKSKFWFRMKGIGIKGYLLGILDGDDSLVDILEESQYCSIASLMALQIGNTSSGLKDRIRHTNTDQAYKLLVESIPGKYLVSAQHISRALVPFYMLGCMLDYFLYLQPDILPDRDAQLFFSQRKEWAKNRPAGLASISFVVMVYKMLEKFNIWNNHDTIALHEQYWNGTPSKKELFAIAKEHESAFAVIVDQNLHSRMNASNITANSFLSLCLRRVGLQASFKRRSCFFKIAPKLIVLKCITPPEQFMCYKYVLSKCIWDDVHRVFN